MALLDVGEQWSKLKPGEERWVGIQPHLKLRGYLLRRRYQPDWKPAKNYVHNDERNLGNVAKLLHSNFINL
jgi:hypothetical protein